MKNKSKKGDLLSISDETLIHRMLTVLRMQIGHAIILFDQTHHYEAQLEDIKKNKLVLVKIISKKENSKPKLEINFALPLLKREALEEAIYSLAEIGVSQISLIITAKSQKNSAQKDLQRLNKIMVAAAEQSKNFAIPTIHDPVPLEKFCADLKETSEVALLFDPAGKPALQVFTQLKSQNHKNIVATIGPEGGLLEQEIKMLQAAHFTSCRLTATVLRAVQAAAVGAGLIATLL